MEKRILNKEGVFLPIPLTEEKPKEPKEPLKKKIKKKLKKKSVDIL